MKPSVKLYDFAPDTSTKRDEVLAGLQKPTKELPSKLFYDARGSALFEQITQLEEYYPTRTELAIMQGAIGEMTALIGGGCLLVEYGSGSSQKTELLLAHLPRMAGYIPIDISKTHLYQTAVRLAQTYPHIEILPVCADYNDYFELPLPQTAVKRRVIYYPGSTIGNFHPPDAVDFLRRVRELCGEQGGILIGVDLKKETAILHDAYNDAAGVTAQFNLNILARLNRELGTDFQLDQFSHDAFYNEAAGRIEMHLVSRQAQTVHLNGSAIPFDAGESIWTESSYKYTLAEFEQLAAAAGLQVSRVWTDSNELFSVQYLTPVLSGST